MAKLPVISGRDARRAFEWAGLTFDRQRGSHMILIKPGVPANLSIPDHRELDRVRIRGRARIRGRESLTSKTPDPYSLLEGVYGLDLLRFLATALGVEYRQAMGRGFEAQNIQQALREHSQVLH